MLYVQQMFDSEMGDLIHIAGTNEFDITLCQLDCANGAYLYFESRSYEQSPFISKIKKLKDIHQ